MSKKCGGPPKWERYPFEGQPILRDEGQRAIDQRAEMLQQIGAVGAGAVDQAAIAELRRTRIPPFYAPLRNLMFDSDLSTWIELRFRGDQLPYFVVDANGEPVGTPEIHIRSRVVAASLTEVWLVEIDDVGVESLIRYSTNWN